MESNSSIKSLMKLIQKVCDENLSRQDSITSGIITQVNSDKTVSLYIPPDKTIFTNIQNQCPFELNPGDTVKLIKEKGRASNMWIIAKCGASYSGIQSDSTSGLQAEIDVLDNSKQDKLIAGENITISGNVISATGGGSQPTLYEPIVNGGVNTVSWSNNTSNGDFPVTLVADVDGDLVSSPLAITEQMDSKVLTVRANSTNFRSSTTTITLAYIASGQSVIAITYTEANFEADTYIYPIIYLTSSIEDNTLIPLYEGASVSGNFVILSAPTIGRNQRLTWTPSVSLYCDHVNSSGYAAFRFDIKQWAKVADTLLMTQDTRSTSALFTGSFAVLDEDGNVVASSEYTNESFSDARKRSISFQATPGETYTIAINGEFIAQS